MSLRNLAVRPLEVATPENEGFSTLVLGLGAATFGEVGGAAWGPRSVS